MATRDVTDDSANPDLSAPGDSDKVLIVDVSTTPDSLKEATVSNLFTSRSLGNTTTITVKDANLTIQDDADTTKQAKFQASGITAGQTRTLTIPDADLTIVGLTTTQTLTNKTLTTPTIGSYVNATHNHENAAGGGTLDEDALALTDVTTNNAGTSKHGFAPKQTYARDSHLTPWITIQKTADEAVQSDTTLSADSDLQFAATNGATYLIRGKIWYTTPAAADFKYRFRGTTAPTLLWVKHKYTAPLAVAETEQAIENIATPTTSTTTISALSAGVVTDPGYIEFEARLVSAGGSFVFDWAQVTSTASDTSVKAGSCIEYMQVA